MTNDLRSAGDLEAAIRPVARRYLRTNNLFIRQINRFGDRFGTIYNRLPLNAHLAIENFISGCLVQIYQAARYTRSGNHGNRLDGAGNTALVAASGALGGAGGLVTTITELPVAIGVIFRGMQRVAAGYGRDPNNVATRQICLSIFSTGSLIVDEDVDASQFIGIRLILQDQLLRSFITRMTPNLLMKFSPKLVSPPVIGAATGSMINVVYIRYYENLAHVYFQLADIAAEFGADAAIGEFLKQISGGDHAGSRPNRTRVPMVWNRKQR